MEHVQGQAKKWSLAASRKPFWKIFGPGPEMVPGHLQKVVLEHFRFTKNINLYLESLLKSCLKSCFLIFRNYYFLNFNLKSNNLIYKCNFCMSDLGINGIADLKHKKFPPTGLHFRPRALRALGRKWKPLGGFSCLRSAIPFLPSSLMQKLPISENHI